MRLRNLIGGVALALSSLLAAPAAFAGTCANPVDSDGNNVTINVTGDCNITSVINVPGAVNITVTGGKLTTTQSITAGTLINLNADSIQGTTLSAGAYVFAQSNVSSINFSGSITANTTGLGYDIQLYSQTTLITGSLNNAGTNGGFIDIWANMAGGSGGLTIDGTGTTTSYVNGTITNTGASSFRNGLLIQNGTASSTGGITILNSSAINVANTGSQAGSIWLNANQGTISLPSGTLSANGSGTQPAGGIVLLGSTISAPSGAVLSATQSTSAPQVGRNIILAASTINFGGSSGLTANANGNYGQVAVLPTGAVTVSDNLNVTSLNWGLNINYSATGSVTFNGTGSPLTLEATGNGGNVYGEGYPFVFNSSSLAITATGGPNNSISLGYGSNSKTGSAGITFNVTGATTIDASGSASQNGGNVTIWEDQVSINGTSFAIKANGPSSGNGSGGTLSLLWSNTILNSATKASFSANGASATTATGSGGSITYWPGAPTLAFGNGAGQMSILARGGKGGGNGGNISVSGNTMSFNGTQTGAMDVSVLGATGDGGTLGVNGGTITFSGTGYKLSANAGTTQGNGGSVSLSAFAALKVGNSAGGVQFSATGSGTGNGGSVTVGGLPLTIAAASVNVAAGSGSGSNATGGSINITSNFGGTVSGNYSANGVGTGPGGTITLKTDTGTITGATFTANGGVSGNGGSISLTTTGSNAVSISGSTKFTANGGTTQGNGGNLSFTTASNLTLDGGSLSVTASGSGTGGTIAATATTSYTLTSTGTWNANGGSNNGDGGTLNLHDNASLSVTGTLSANGEGSGAGGTITVDSLATDISQATVTAIGGSNNGVGGTLDISSPVAQFDQDSAIDVDAGDDSTGCCTASAARPALGPPIDGVKNYTDKSNGFVAHCQQWSTGSRVWNLAYWDCSANYANPTAIDQVPSNLAQSSQFANLRTILNTHLTEIYVVADNKNYNAIFHDNQVAATGGVTSAIGHHVYMSPWQSGSIGSIKPQDVVTYTSAQYTEVSAHELGHSVDIAFGLANDSGSTLYKAWLKQDTNTLDYADAAFTVQRLPCAQTQIPGQPAGTYYPGAIPFANVTDTTTKLPVCVNGQLNNAVLLGGTWPANTFNSQVLSTLDPGLWVPTAQTPAWVEPHAQMFAYNAVGNLNARPFDDAVFDAGYFPCLKAWAASELTGALPTAACTLTIH